MDLKLKIKTLIKEAELYRNQGLLAEAKESYEQVIALVKKNLAPSDGQKIINNIADKIDGIEKEIRRVEKKVLSPRMTKESQDLITKMFDASEGEDEDTAAMEGAKALIKFGQFDRAKVELDRLLNIESKRVEAARHIINCFFLESKFDGAVEQYRKWQTGDLFTPKQLEALKGFIERTFKNKGVQTKLSEVQAQEKVIELDAKKIQKQQTTPPSQKPVQTPAITEPVVKPKIAEPVTAEKENEDFEEFDILASIKKSKKPENK